MEDHLLCPHGQKGLGLYFSERWTAGQFSSISRSKWINESPLLKPCRVLERTARRAPSLTPPLSPLPPPRGVSSLGKEVENMQLQWK